MSTSSPMTHLYRSLLRELRLSSKQVRTTRNPAFITHLRALTASTDENTLHRTLSETRDFLRASRTHTELLRRYNPLHDMTEEERIRATARRVGLDSPIQYKPE